MTARSIRCHRRPRAPSLLALVTLALVALACATEPNGVDSVSVSPSGLSFAGTHAPAQTLMVTVTGTNGKARTDIPVTWTFWLAPFEPLSPTSNVIRMERQSATTWSVRPLGVPGAAFVYANAGGQRSAPITIGVTTGPPVALLVERQPPAIALRGVPMYVFVQTIDAEGFATRSEVPITASLASGTGTLSGVTTVNAAGGLAEFINLVIDGTGVFTLRFTSPGLTSIVSNPITVTAP